MSDAVKPIPDGYHATTPYLYVRGGDAAIAFYKAAFGAVELLRMGAPGGKVGHAEIRIGDSVVMLADEAPERGIRGPLTLGGTAVGLLLYVERVDEVFARAVAAGGVIERSVENQFYGDRMGTIRDPFGHVWFIATHVEDVPPEEMERRARAARG